MEFEPMLTPREKISVYRFSFLKALRTVNSKRYGVSQRSSKRRQL